MTDFERNINGFILIFGIIQIFLLFRIFKILLIGQEYLTKLFMYGAVIAIFNVLIEIFPLILKKL